MVEPDPAPASVEPFPSPSSHPARRRWLRFGLRSPLVLVAVIALPLGWWVKTIRRQQEAIATIRAFNPTTVDIIYEEQTDLKKWPAWFRGPLAWVQNRIPPDYRLAVVGIHVRGERSSPSGPTAGDAIAAALRLDRLEVLQLAVTVRDADLAALPRLTRLQHLSLTRPSPELSDAGLGSIGATPSLAHLEISDCGATDAGVARLAALPLLQDLSLGDTDAVIRGRAQFRVTGSGLGRLANSTKLQTVALRSPRLTPEGIAHLGSLRQIRMLELYGPVTNEDLPRLASLPHLFQLILGATRLDGTNFDLLAQCPELRWLHLDSNPIGDSAWPALSRLTRLGLLSLRDTDVTPAGVARLRGRLPSLKIVVRSIRPGDPQRTRPAAQPTTATPKGPSSTFGEQ